MTDVKKNKLSDEQQALKDMFKEAGESGFKDPIPPYINEQIKPYNVDDPSTRLLDPYNVDLLDPHNINKPSTGP